MDWTEQVSFGGGAVDRMAAHRGEAEALLTRPGTRVLPMWRGRPLVEGADGAPRLVLLPADHALIDEASALRVLLGRPRGGAGSATEAVFAADLSGWHPESLVAGDGGPGRAGEDQRPPDVPGLPDDARFSDLRGMLASLGREDGSLAATARGILEWHRTHGFCATCGAPTLAAEGGWLRRCPSCGRQHFPRTDPVVIMLVTHGNSVLLGRSPHWPERMYSVLAGFMEPGETVADAVRREVEEEVGLRVGRVRMLASQPWPFPASLMIGCATEAAGRALALDPVEIEDALWLSREDLLDAFAGRHEKVAPPRKGAIAQHLLHMWLADGLD
jgi:NAD+ diphosphatase